MKMVSMIFRFSVPAHFVEFVREEPADGFPRGCDVPLPRKKGKRNRGGARRLSQNIDGSGLRPRCCASRATNLIIHPFSDILSLARIDP